MKLQLLGFDLFNTVFSMNKATEESRQAYATQIKANLEGRWAPFVLDPQWEYLDPQPGAAEALQIIREHYTIVTFSNAPASLQIRMLTNAGLDFDGITPLECFSTSKPAKWSYQYLYKLWGYLPSQCAVVTANETFGDLAGAHHVGMGAYWVGAPQYPTLMDLAKHLYDVAQGGV